MLVIYIQLLLSALLPIGISVGFFLLQRFTKFNSIKPIYQQIIIGLVFGGVAIFGTECGVSIGESAVANIRDAGPICAALIFGGPSGIIAGIIGGVERFFAVYWGAGLYSQLACTISTILTGILCTIIRHHLFSNKIPSWVGALVVAIIMEVMHLMMLFLTHVTEPYECINILKQITVPMILANVVAVTISVLIINILLKDEATKTFRNLNQKIQFWLLVLMAGAYGGSSAFIYFVQTYYAYETATSVLKLNTNDISSHILSYSNEYLEIFMDGVNSSYTDENKDINEILDIFKESISQINIISLDKEGIVLNSTDPTNIGFQMIGGPSSSEQSIDFHTHMLNENSYTQQFSNASVSQEYIKYSAKKLSFTYQGKEAYLQVGVSAHKFYTTSGVSNIIDVFTSHRHVYSSGFLVIFDYDDKIISDESEHTGVPVGINGEMLEQLAPLTLYRSSIYDIDSYYMYKESETYYTLAVVPVTDVLNTRDVMIYANSFAQIIIYGLIFALSYFAIEKIVVNYIKNTNETLKLIIEGDLNQKVESNKVLELNELSNSINITVDTLKKYIEKAASRIDKELLFAKKIQSSSLPSAFPAFPTRHDFDIYATMDTARQVGGDFYDFYLTNADSFFFLVADVSGKGIPASMFMMEAKTAIKNLATSLNSVNDIFYKANNDLAISNEANMFVTCWMGNIDLSTGVVKFANAGHNNPLIYHKGQGWEYISQKRDLVLAAMENNTYHEQEIKLNVGDKLFLYTDGVVEATRKDNVLYGEERLLSFLNTHVDLDLDTLLKEIKKDIDTFIEGADQFDDITMLIFEYKGK